MQKLPFFVILWYNQLIKAQGWVPYSGSALPADERMQRNAVEGVRIVLNIIAADG